MSLEMGRITKDRQRREGVQKEKIGTKTTRYGTADVFLINGKLILEYPNTHTSTKLGETEKRLRGKYNQTPMVKPQHRVIWMGQPTQLQGRGFKDYGCTGCNFTSSKIMDMRKHISNIRDTTKSGERTQAEKTTPRVRWEADRVENKSEKIHCTTCNYTAKSETEWIHHLILFDKPSKNQITKGNNEKMSNRKEGGSRKKDNKNPLTKKQNEPGGLFRSLLEEENTYSGENTRRRGLTREHKTKMNESDMTINEWLTNMK